MFYVINEDISDGLIEDNAKIWCMFCNTDVSKALDVAINQTKNKTAEDIKEIENKEENDLQNSDSDNAELNESLLNEAPKIKIPKPKSTPTPKPKPRPKPRPKPAPKPKPKPAPKPKPKKPLGKKIVTGMKVTYQAGKIGVLGGASYKAYDYFYGDGDPNAVKVNQDGTIDIDSWDDASFKDQRAAVEANPKILDSLPALKRWKYLFIAPRTSRGWPAENIALAVAAAYGLWKSRDYIWTRVKEFADWISSGKSLAVCEFKSDGDDYKAVFDIKAKKWKLYYAGSTVTKESSYPPNAVADKFFNTKFFNKLTLTCFKHTEKYLNDKAFAAIAAAACETKGIDSSSKDALKDIFKNRNQILENLKNGKYDYI